MTLESATEGFVRSFCFLKSRTHPYEPKRIGRLWVLRDNPPRKRGRIVEVVSEGSTPAETSRLIQEARLGWHFVVAVQAIGEDTSQLRTDYKSLGYRALSTEWMFVHDGPEAPDQPSEPRVRCVKSEEILRTIPQVAPQPRKWIEGTRLYGIWDDRRDYGWVRSVPDGPCGWAYDLYVYANFRGHGHGRALMSRLIADDRASGLRCSALIASTAGARLYPHLGYRAIATLQIFSPVRRDRS